jgi:GNAT superfamily N-acetyltransferase
MLQPFREGGLCMSLVEPYTDVRLVRRTTDTRRAEIRQLAVEDIAEVQSFLLRLDRSSRCARFGHAASDACLCAHANEALSNAIYTIGAFVDDELHGILEIYSCVPQDYCEVALVVEQNWRRRGYGWNLLCAARQWTSGMNEVRIRLIFPRNNWPMRELANKANARFDLVLDEICADIGPKAALSN